MRHGFGGISVYVGLRGTAEELRLSGKHYWAMWTKAGDEDLDAITESYLQRPQEQAASGPIPLLFISFPSAKDPLWEQKHPGQMATSCAFAVVRTAADATACTSCVTESMKFLMRDSSLTAVDYALFDC